MNNKIIVALDTSDINEAMSWVTSTKHLIDFYKIGLELFFAEGRNTILEVKKIAPEAKIFLDVKLNDIPTTIAKSVKTLAKLPIDYITIHSLFRSDALKAAKDNAPDNLTILNVGLMSSDMQFKSIINNRSLQAWAYTVASYDKTGIIVNAETIDVIAKTIQNPKLNFKPVLIAPGIRLDTTVQDHHFPLTPENAIKKGADFIIMGRPIIQSENCTQLIQNINNSISF